MYNRSKICLVFAFALLLVLPLSAQNRVTEIRKAIQEKDAQWAACENAVSTLPPVARKRLLGAQRPARHLAKARKITLSTMAHLPSALDWRDHNGNWVTPVKAQGACGSCWDFSAIAQVESWWMITHNRLDSLPDLSEQYILCAADAGNCDGGGVQTALTFIQEHGVPPEDFFTYQANDNLSCPPDLDQWADQMTFIPDWGYVTLGDADVDLIKQALMRHPVSASYTVFSDFFYYQSGIYEHVSGEEEGAHAVLIVGWNDEDRCWIVKNSWGPNWGENGYFRIRWGECSMGTDMPFIYSHHTQNARVTTSHSAFDFTLAQGDQQAASFTLENPSSHTVEYSVIDDQRPMVIHSTTQRAYAGQSIWFADADLGGYDNHWLLRLDLPVLNLTSAAAPVFTLKANWNVEPPGINGPYDGWDGWNVWISTDGGHDFHVLIPEGVDYNSQSLWSYGDADQGWGMGPGIPGWGGSSEGWKEIAFNLDAYKGFDRVVLRLALASDMAYCSVDESGMFGLLVDDLRVTDGGHTLFEHDGNDLEGLRQLSLGSQPATWLTLGTSRGEIEPGGSAVVSFLVETAGLDQSVYEGLLHVELSDATQAKMAIPVSLKLTTAVPGTRSMPEAISLWPAYPNPFNQGTVIPIDGIAGGADTRVSIFDTVGRHVKTLLSGRLSEGRQNLYWDGRDDQGRALPSGVYIVVMQSGKHRLSRKICQVK